MTGVEALLPRGDAVDLDGPALTAWLADRYALAGDAWLRLNLISGLGGQTTGPSGTSADLTDGIDRPLLRTLRASGDVVLIGAATLRAETLPLPADRPLAVVTLSGDLPADRIPEPVGDRRLLVLCPDALVGDVTERMADRATVVGAGPDPGPTEVVGALAGLGMPRVVCEGGGRLAGAFFAADLVDEFDQTIAPVAVSPGPPAIAGEVPSRSSRLIGLLRDETDRLYARWSFRSVV